MITIKSALNFVATLMAICLFDTSVCHSQDFSVPKWFQIEPPEIDLSANEAVDNLSAGMSSVILALNGGRSNRGAVDPEPAESVIKHLRSAYDGLQKIMPRIASRKINSIRRLRKSL